MSQPRIASDPFASLSPDVRRNMRFAMLEGSLSNVMGTLVGGAYLTGFALLLGAQDAHIGLLAAIPAFLNLTQIFGSILIRRFGSRRRLCLIAIGLSRTVWLSILSIPFWLIGDGFGDGRVWLLMAGIALVSLFSSAAGVAWLSWLTDLVPAEVRGRFNGKRSMYAGIAAMSAGLAGGPLIELLGGRDVPSAFSAIFAIGVTFGFLALLAMARITEPAMQEPAQSASFFKEIREPFRDKRFLSFSSFIIVWSFGVSIASPFFSVFMIRSLGVSFSLIALFGVASSVATILGMRLWGGVLDRIGPKPLLIVCGLGQACVPLAWLAAGPDNVTALWVSHILGGFASAGTGLANTAMLVQVSPSGNTAPYFGVHAALVGLAGASAPLVGGAAGAILAGSVLSLGPVQFEGLRIIFLISAAVRFLSLGLLARVDAGKRLEPEEIAASLRRIQTRVPIFGVNQAVGFGLAAVENVNLSVARGSAAMERWLEREIERGWQTLKRAKSAAERIDSKVDARLARHEGRIDALIDRIIAVWERIRTLLRGRPR